MSVCTFDGLPAHARVLTNRIPSVTISFFIFNLQALAYKRRTADKNVKKMMPVFVNYMIIYAL